MLGEVGKVLGNSLPPVMLVAHVLWAAAFCRVPDRAPHLDLRSKYKFLMALLANITGITVSDGTLTFALWCAFRMVNLIPTKTNKGNVQGHWGALSS